MTGGGQTTVVGYLHPGAMGAAVAAICSATGLWASEGRSAATRSRAESADLTDVTSVAELARQADVVISVCPPAEALAVADTVAATGFDGCYVDANAVAPATARAIGARFGDFVDGGIIGPPPSEQGTTRLYLSGPSADSVARLWSGSDLEVHCVGGGPGAASAVKMCFAGWTKGTSALLLAVRALAVAEGVEDAIVAEWETSMPELIDRAEATATVVAPKSWRFIGEMEEIAATFAANDLPDGFHRAATEVYARLGRFKDDDPPPGLAAVVAEILAR